MNDPPRKIPYSYIGWVLIVIAIVIAGVLGYNFPIPDPPPIEALGTLSLDAINPNDFTASLGNDYILLCNMNSTPVITTPMQSTGATWTVGGTCYILYPLLE